MPPVHTHEEFFQHGRDPCPWVILKDAGGSFALGAIGGTLWHAVKGLQNSPSGQRRIGAITAVKLRAPVIGGNFAAWCALFSTFDCAIRGVRKKSDRWNSVGAGFFTGGCLALRGGIVRATNGAIACAVLVGVIEGVSTALTKMMAHNRKLVAPTLPEDSK